MATSDSKPAKESGVCVIMKPKILGALTISQIQMESAFLISKLFLKLFYNFSLGFASVFEPLET